MKRDRQKIAKRRLLEIFRKGDGSAFDFGMLPSAKHHLKSVHKEEVDAWFRKTIKGAHSD